MNELDSDTASSILTNTASFTSTIPGLGATSGKALKRLGSAVINGVEAILIRRRNAQLETIFKENKPGNPANYDDLLSVHPMNHSDTASSILTNTATFTSTILGLGATSGKALKLVGSVVVNGVDAILIHRRISQLETIFEQKKLGIESANYDDLLELSRSVYEPSIRKRAFQVIMGIVGGMDFEDLAFAVSEWHPSESHDLLKEMVLCFRLENGSDETGRLPSSYIQSQNSNTSKEAPLCNAFLLFIALVISFSQTPSFSKLVIHELDVLAFIAQTFPATVLNADSEFDSSIQNPLLPAKLVFCTLLEKLDPTVDSLDAPSIAQLTVILSTTALNSVSLEHVHPLRTVIHRYHHTRERRHSGHGNQHSNVTGDVHILNTVIQRYHYTKEFKDSHHGSEFFGYWLSIVYINNREYGRAIGRTRGEAREHAAHQALLVFHL